MRLRRKGVGGEIEKKEVLEGSWREKGGVGGEMETEGCRRGDG